MFLKRTDVYKRQVNTQANRTARSITLCSFDGSNRVYGCFPVIIGLFYTQNVFSTAPHWPVSYTHLDVYKRQGISAPTFWEQYRRKPLGMVGLSMVAVYVFVAIFAPFLTPYNPKQILLADRIAAPIWFRSILPKYDDAPSTIRTTLGPDEWAVSEATGGKLASEELEGNAVSAVSYTHLDVYKRQKQNKVRSCYRS